MLREKLDPTLYHRDPGPHDARLSMTYLGTAGFVFEAEGHTVVVDPYISRPGLRDTLFRPLVPDAERIHKYVPKADDVLVGHAHHDHVLDAPVLCEQTGARLIGSPSVCNVGRSYGLPERQLVQTTGKEDIASGPGSVRGLPSRHGRVFFDRVGMPGDIPRPFAWPAKVGAFRHGLVLNWLVELGGVRVLHIDSADFIDQELQGVECDVLCLCAIGRVWRPWYTARAIELTRPKVVVPCHWDLFTTPIEEEPYLIPGVDIPGFLGEIERAGCDHALLPFFGTLRV
ncbi:MAG: MBL fold metallo-hydrolase [Deltaproteobacteria bacterium]|nr:MAG: MBL fold metallo-hydrolase [Deltaproteobacteria bacterium]